MQLLTQLLFLVSYAVLAAAVALVLPSAQPGIDAMTGYIIGVAVFLASALLHENIARRRATRELGETIRRAWNAQSADLDALQNARQEIAAEIADLHRDVREIEARVGQGAGQAVITEMRVLQDQLSQLAVARGDVEHAVAQPLAATGGGRSRTTLQVVPSAATPLGPDEILDTIRSALRDNRIDLYLQPIVSLPQRKLRFHEAFSRLRTPSGDIIGPEDYLDIACAEGLVSTIDNLLLFRCVQLARKIKRRRRGGPLFINVSTHTLADDDFITEFVLYLEGHADLADHLIFELSQADLLSHGDRVQVCLDRLAELGFGFSMDRVHDLGIDFDALPRRHVKFVKVSSDLLLGDGRASGAVLHPADFKEALQRNNIDLIADHIEDEREVVELLDYALDFGQGYLFGPPRPARED